jgi:hypothetical protein
MHVFVACLSFSACFCVPLPTPAVRLCAGHHGARARHPDLLLPLRPAVPPAPLLPLARLLLCAGGHPHPLAGGPLCHGAGGPALAAPAPPRGQLRQEAGAAHRSRGERQGEATAREAERSGKWVRACTKTKRDRPYRIICKSLGNPGIARRRWVFE